MQEITDLFEKLMPDEKYRKLMELGQALPSFPKEKQILKNLVKGCQSQMWIDLQVIDNQLLVNVSSDALISAGIGAVACMAFNGKTPHEAIALDTSFLSVIGSLSPSRSSGLQSLILMIKQKTIPYL